MKTLKILALTCLLAAPIFADKKPLALGKVTNQKSLNAAAPSKTSLPQNESLVVKIMTPIKHRVKKGENLYRIAKRYRVTVDEIRSQKINPSLAVRKNKNFLLRGEVINIPVYRVRNMPFPPDNYAGRIFYDGDLVAMEPEEASLLRTRAYVLLEERDKKIDSLQLSMAGTRKLIVGCFVAILTLLGLVVTLGSKLTAALRREQLLTEEARTKADTVNATANSAPESPVDPTRQTSNTGAARELI